MKLIKAIRTTAPFLLLCALPLFLASCKTGPKPGRYAIQIEVDDAMADVAMVVHFIADPASERGRWEALNINDYWSTSSLRRDANPVTLRFGPNQSRIQTIEISQPRYAEWLRQKPLFAVLIRDHPIHLANPGPDDPRRLIVSLDQRTWVRRSRQLKILIQESGMKVETPLRLKK